MVNGRFGGPSFSVKATFCRLPPHKIYFRGWEVRLGPESKKIKNFHKNSKLYLIALKITFFKLTYMSFFRQMLMKLICHNDIYDK